jgi:hypothetical protein
VLQVAKAIADLLTQRGGSPFFPSYNSSSLNALNAFPEAINNSYKQRLVFGFGGILIPFTPKKPLSGPYRATVWSTIAS